MTGFAVVLDPVSEAATNAELAWTEANGIRHMEHKHPPPEDEDILVGSADTEGDSVGNRRPKNRVITDVIRVFGSTDGAFRTAMRNLEKKIGKLKREGGTYKLTLPSGDVIVFDLIGGSSDYVFSHRFMHSRMTEVTIEFPAKPYGRGAPLLLSDHVETALPCLVFTEASIPGDVPALGKLVLDEDQGVDQEFIVWGLQSRDYDSSADAALFYQAESRVLLADSSLAAGASGASGAGSNVVRNTNLVPAWQAIMSTQTSGGVHLRHVGTYRVWARMYRPTSNTGQVSVRLSWSEGDFRRFTVNSATVFPANDREGQFVLVDLGLVQLGRALQGTQQWQGRIEACSTVLGDEIDIDCLFIVPVTEGYGESRAIVQVPAPTAFSARDEFDQTAGAATGKALPLGGNWTVVAGSDATDFQINAVSHMMTRTGGLNLRMISAGATVYTAIAVQCDCMVSANPTLSGAFTGVFGRLVDINNWFGLYIGWTYDNVFGTAFNVNVSYSERVGGVEVATGSKNLLKAAPSIISQSYTVRLLAARNRWWAWAWPTGGPMPSVPTFSGSSVNLFTGGALDDGRIGVIDVDPPGTSGTRSYDNFQAWVPSVDAAVFASQSCEIRHDRVLREDSGGSLWVSPSRYEGDYLLIPPSGLENRTARFFAKTSRNDPDYGADGGIDDLSGRLTITPRYHAIPE